MRNRSVLRLCLLAVVLLASSAFAVETIPANRAKQIYDAAPDKPRVQPRSPRRAMIWITPAHLMDKDPHKGYCIPYGAAAFEALGKKTGAFQPIISDDLAMFFPENIKQFNTIIMNNSSGPWITPTDDDMGKDAFKKHGADKKAVEQVLRQSLLDYVNGGGGIMAIHYSIGANGHWPEFQQLLGGKFIGHPWNEEIGITVEEPGHPLAAAFGGKDFRLADEIFHYGDPFDRGKLRVLLSIDTERTNMGVKWIERKDNDFALAWVKSIGKGRIFYTSFGHRTELYWNPPLLTFYLDAIQFATGDLDAPTAPRADRPVKRAPGPTPPEVRAAKMQAKNIAAPTEAQIRQIETAAPAAAPAKPAKKRRVLVWGHAWAYEENPHTEKALEILGRKTGAFEAVISDDPRLLLGDQLPRFDALVLIPDVDPFLPAGFVTLGAEQRAAARKFDQAVKESILEFVRSGKGIVGFDPAHAGPNWSEYAQLMGDRGAHDWEKGRVFHAAPGYSDSAYWSRPFLARLLAGVQYVTGDLPSQAIPQWP